MTQFLLLAALAANIPIDPVPAPQDSGTVITRVRQRITESNRLKAARMRCKKIKVVTDLKTSRVIKVEVFEVYGKNGLMMQRKVKTREYKENTPPEVIELDIQTDCSGCRDADDAEELLGTDLNDPAFTAILDFTFARTEGDQYVYRISPKKNAQPPDGRYARHKDEMDEVLKRLEGEVHVDPKQGFILHMDGMVKSFRKFLFFKLSEFKMRVEQGEIDSMIFTREITITVKYSDTISETYARHAITFKDFVILPPVSEPASTLPPPEMPLLPGPSE